MAVLNVTPDSFSDGGCFLDPATALEQAASLSSAGADILDLGAESTRPGSLPVPAEEQLRRLIPVLRMLVDRTEIPISIDTTSSEVAAKCLEAGAHMVNDVSAFRSDPQMIHLLAESGAPAVAMHSRGRPETMQDDPRYDDVVREVVTHLAERVDACVSGGIEKTQVV
ncbi:MAG: dihydropteroate synthase, partial [Myxococcota bacterium]|nr:dihydropteroate synthase [Myxococcota bacterium]